MKLRKMPMRKTGAPKITGPKVRKGGFSPRKMKGLPRSM